MMNKGLIFLGYIAGLFLIIFSMVFTAILFESLSSGTWLGKALAGVGVCVDVGKIVCASAMILFVTQKKYGIACVCVLFYVGCFGISMVASQSLDLNKANEIKQETMINSDEYKRNIEIYDGAKTQITDLQAQINTVTSTKDQKISESLENLKAERSKALKNNWITSPQGSPRRGVDIIDSDIAKTRANVSNSIDNQVAGLNARIEALNSQKNSTKEELSSLKDSGVVATKGILAMAEWVYSQGYGSSSMDVLGKFYLFKNVFTELLGTWLLLLAGMKLEHVQVLEKSGKSDIETDKKDIPTKNNTLKEKFGAFADKLKNKLKTPASDEPQIATITQRPKKTFRRKLITANRKIGFDTTSSAVNENDDFIKEDDYKNYVETMFEKAKGNISPGYKTISTLAKINLKDAHKIKNHLERLRMTEVTGNKTIILASKENMLLASTNKKL